VAGAIGRVWGSEFLGLNIPLPGEVTV